ncbi:MAG: AEC family transporter [Anaeroplasma bactoclasticum]|nr:AEC family transporter [Anaeroplasma bactoclasticum]
MEAIFSILKDKQFLSAILTSLAFILLGFLLSHYKILNRDGKKVISFLTLKIALPAMAFNSFMTDFHAETFLEHLVVLVLSILLYIFFLCIGQLFFFRTGKEKRRIYSILMTVGQFTFFSIPVLLAIYGGEIMIYANMVTIVFRFILYIYCYLVMSKLHFNSKNLKSSLRQIILNPIMIAMFIGLLIWLTQNIVPQVSVNQIDYSIFRIDQTLPAIYQVLDVAKSLTTPLAMILVGSVLGEEKIGDAVKNKMAWILALLRTIFVPLVVLLLLLLLQVLQIVHLSPFALATLVIGFGAPLSAVVNTYASQFDTEASLSSQMCLLSTLICLISFPLIYLLIQLVLQLPIF